MKIPEGVTKKNIIDQINALKETHKEYVEHRHKITYCQLCIVCANYKTQSHGCKQCPWVWFTNKSCSGYYHKNELSFFVLSSDDPRHKSLRDNRKKQIKRWIKKLEEYNDRHK